MIPGRDDPGSSAGEEDAEYAAAVVVGELIPELYEDEVYVWEIAAVLRRLAMQDAAIAAVVDRYAHDAAGFVREVTLAAVGRIVALPGVETFFTGWPLDGDWQPRRATMPAGEVVGAVRGQWERLGREPVALEIAFFRGVEG